MWSAAGSRGWPRSRGSLADVPGVESDDVARAFLPAAALTLEEREGLVGDALDAASGFVHAHLARADVARAHREGRLSRAFLFPKASSVLRTSTSTR